MTYQNLNSVFSDNLARWIPSKAGLTLLCVWAFFEANFWFIAPDFILMVFAAYAPRNYKKYVLWALGASLLGGVFYYALNMLYPHVIADILRQTPFVQPRMFKFVDGLYSDHGYLGIMFQSFSFMSFKIWTFLAVEHEFNPVIYFPVVMVSRYIRLFITTWLAVMVASRAREFFKKHSIVILAIYPFLVIAFLMAIERP